MKYTSIIFITPTNKILLVKLRKDNKWTLPIGDIELTDNSIWNAALRNFYEDLGIILNTYDITSNQSYNYHNHTMIYIIHSNQIINNFIPNIEIIKLKFIRINKLINIINNSLSNKIKPRTIKLLKKIFLKNLINPNPLNLNQLNPLNPNPLNLNPLNPLNPNPLNLNPLNPNPLNPNPLNLNSFNSNPLNIKTLIYIGDNYDPLVNCSGNHITIAGYNDIDTYRMINIVKSCYHVFNIYNGYRGWKMKPTTSQLYKESNGNHQIRIKSDTFNRFGLLLSQYGVKSIKYDYHLNLNTLDTNIATLQYSKYTQTYHIFNIYVIEHNLMTNMIKWNII